MSRHEGGERGGRPEASRVLHFYSTLSFFRPVNERSTDPLALAPSRWRFPGQASCAVSLRKEYVKTRGVVTPPLLLSLQRERERHTRGSTGSHAPLQL